MHASGERWLLPEGIEEILPRDAARIERCRRSLIDLFASWGYQLVMPPFIEYLETLLCGTGPDVDLQTFKIIDQLSGRSMGVRADMTPQVARIDAHSLRREEPARLCYLGTVLHTRPDGFSGARSPIQVGAELYGHAGAASDCEIICLMLETLKTAGIAEMHLDIGHMGVFRSLARQAALDPSQEAALFSVLQRKARSEIEALLTAAAVPAEVAGMILALAHLNGGEDVLLSARSELQCAAPDVLDYIARLEELARALRSRMPEVPLHFDLAELRGYRYERGVVFAAFVPGHGQEIARGGRYDGVGEAFGRPRAAIGFSTDLKTLVAMGSPDEDPPVVGIFAPSSDQPELHRKVRELRSAGERVVVELSGQSGDARTMGCDRRLVLDGAVWVVEALS